MSGTNQLRVAASLLVAMAVGLGAQSAPPGTKNYTRIDANVACAGATPVEAIAAIKADGFKAIINLRQASEDGANVESSRAAAEAAGLKYFHVPFNSADPKSEVVDQFLEVVKNPDNSPVFIHCATANRVGMMWLIKRVVLDGWPVDKATAEARQVGLTNARLEAFALEYLKTHGKA